MFQTEGFSMKQCQCTELVSKDDFRAKYYLGKGNIVVGALSKERRNEDKTSSR